MKSKEQEKSDFWEAIVVLGGGLIIGGVCGFIAMLTGSEPTSIIGIFCAILVGLIVFCAIAIWIDKKLHITNTYVEDNDKPSKSKQYSKLSKKESDNKLVKCRVCGNLIPKSVKNCSYCGYSNYEKPNYRVHEKIETYENIKRKELGCKKCPFCGKTILKKDRKCRYCKRAL